MRRYLRNVIIIVSALLLSSCVYHNGPGPNTDLATERWSQLVDANPAKWTAGADSWFLEGMASGAAESMRRDAPAMAAMSTMNVRMPNNITDIKVNGCFRVQIFGTNADNSLYVYGPNSAVRGVVVKMKDNTLYLTQAKEAPTNMGCVIIRIGIRDLRVLKQMGSGSIEGRLVRSTCLAIKSCGCGSIYLGGMMNVTSITSSGQGNVNVFGAITPVLDITTSGGGSVNVSGNVGVRNITHHGTGDINVIGGNSDGVTVYADGKGKIGLNGRMAIDKIDARDKTCVFAYYVNADTLNVLATDNAQIGLAGCVKNLYVDAGKSSRVSGHYLYTETAYVRAHDAAHINVTASAKIFAASTQNSSIYFFGSPATLSQFYRENGVIIPIPGDKPRGKRNFCPYYRHRAAYIGET